jgi:antitoxin MazE
MRTTVVKWGRSQGVRLDPELLAEAGLSVGDAVTIAARNGSIVIRPARRAHRRHDLRTLVRRIPKGPQVIATEWGAPAGREVW